MARAAKKPAKKTTAVAVKEDKRRLPIDIRYLAIVMLMAGDSPQHVAAQLELSPSTVVQWKKNLRSALDELRQEQRTQIELDLFHTIVLSQRAIHAQLRIAADETWIRKQTASDLAILHGIISDKSIRLLEALSAASDGDSEGGAG